MPNSKQQQMQSLPAYVTQDVKIGLTKRIVGGEIIEMILLGQKTELAEHLKSAKEFPEIATLIHAAIKANFPASIRIVMDAQKSCYSRLVKDIIKVSGDSLLSVEEAIYLSARIDSYDHLNLFSWVEENTQLVSFENSSIKKVLDIARSHKEMTGKSEILDALRITE